MNKTRELAFGAMIIAVILLMALVPFLGYIQINVVSITLIHIPVLIGAMTFKNRNLAIISGVTFGISSWYVAMTRPLSPIDIVFQNPLVSILPRIIFALLAYYLYKQLSKNKEKNYVSMLIAIIISCLMHTIMVISLLYIFGQSNFNESLLIVLVGVFGANGWIEIVIASIICPPIIVTLNKIIRID